MPRGQWVGETGGAELDAGLCSRAFWSFRTGLGDLVSGTYRQLTADQNATLMFEAGDSSGTIEVGVLDDAHDEGEETLTLRLSTRRAASWRTARRPGR